MTRDALFGPDGTQLPEPAPVLPDPLVAPGSAIGTDRYVSWAPTPAAPPSMPLPAGVDPAEIHEAIRAAMGAEPAAHRPAPRPTTSQPTQPTQQIQHTQPAAPYIESMRTPPSGIPAQPAYPQPPPQQPPPQQRVGVPSAAQRTGLPPEVQRRAEAMQRIRQAAAARDHLTEPRRSPSGGGWIGCVVLLIFIAIIVYNLISSLVNAITGG